MRDTNKFVYVTLPFLRDTKLLERVESDLKEASIYQTLGQFILSRLERYYEIIDGNSTITITQRNMASTIVKKAGLQMKSDGDAQVGAAREHGDDEYLNALDAFD
jgi:hypothetical protein